MATSSPLEDWTDAFRRAVKHGRINDVLTILPYKAHINVNAVYGRHRRTALMKACRSGRKCIVQLLLNMDVDVDMVDSHHYSALMYAVDRNRLSVVQLLLRHRPHINPRDGLPSALTIAAQGRHYILPLLLSERANVHHVYQHYQPLQLAALTHNAECVRLLLDAGAWVNACSVPHTCPALIYAVTKTSQPFCLRTLKLLLDAGADPNVISPQGSAVYLTLVNGWWAGTDALIERGGVYDADSRRLMNEMVALAATITPQHTPQDTPQGTPQSTPKETAATFMPSSHTATESYHPCISPLLFPQGLHTLISTTVPTNVTDTPTLTPTHTPRSARAGSVSKVITSTGQSPHSTPRVVSNSLPNSPQTHSPHIMRLRQQTASTFIPETITTTHTLVTDTRVIYAPNEHVRDGHVGIFDHNGHIGGTYDSAMGATSSYPMKMDDIAITGSTSG